MHRHTQLGQIRQQRGAALVVGMILLLVLTLLAMSGMNTASTELVMAGNEQYQENAFQASETGIEIAMRDGPFNPSTASVPVLNTPVGASTTDYYSTNITPQPGLNMPMQALWGNRWDSFSTFHFAVQSVVTLLKVRTHALFRAKVGFPSRLVLFDRLARSRS